MEKEGRGIELRMGVSVRNRTKPRGGGGRLMVEANSRQLFIPSSQILDSEIR